MIYNSTMVDFYFVYKYTVGYILFKPQKMHIGYHEVGQVLGK